MKKLLIFLLFTLILRASAQITCGLPGVSSSQSCFNTNITPVPLPNPIPSWGPNTSAVVAAGGNPYLMQTVGNLTGSGTSVTPTDFGLPVVRCTDSTFFGGLFWGLSDSGAPNLFNSNDSLFLAKANGGTHYLIHFDSNTGACLPVSGITYTKDVLFSHTNPNVIYVLIGTNSNQLYQDTISVTCSPACSGSVTVHTLLYDFATANCLQNAYNGNPTWAGGGSVGVFSSSLDDTTFSNYFSDTGISGQRGRWAASWSTSYGSGNCDLLDTQSMKYRSHGGTQSITTITPAFHAGDRFALHETYSALNNNYIVLSAAVNSYTYGKYAQNLYFWQTGTASVAACGYAVLAGANPISGSSVIGNITSGTFVLGETVTQTGTGAHAVIIAPLVIAAMPLVVGTITGSPNGTGTWVGGSSGAVFTPTASPALNATINYECGGHFGQGYTQLVTGKNGTANRYTNPATPLTSTAPNSAPCSDSHYSWNFTNTTDSYPALITTQGYGALAFTSLATIQTVGSATKCTTDPTFAGIPLYYDENYYNNIGTGKVLRTNHTFNSGWSWSFDVQNAGVGIESSSGKWHAFLTDGWGQFGSTDGNAEANIGGPDWNNSFTGFKIGTGFGSFITPQTANAGHYIYHVASCSSSPCTTGAVAPIWPQTSTPHTTVVDGNVTWETYPDAHNSAISAISNARSEIMFVKLFTSGTPPPPPPPGVTIAPGSLFSIQNLLQ